MLGLVSMLANFWHAWFSSLEVNLDWPYIILRVISVVVKFHAFIINLNNSVFFWWITAGLKGLFNNLIMRSSTKIIRS